VVLAEKVRKMFVDMHSTSKRAWIMYVRQIIRDWSVGVLLLLNSVTTYFKNLGWWD